LEAHTFAFLGMLALATVLAAFRDVRRNGEVNDLVEEYCALYGAPPPGFKVQATGLGWAVGSVAGSSAAGGVVGAAIDLARRAWSQRGMSPEQKRLSDRINGLRAWSPFLTLLIFGVWMALVWIVVVMLDATPTSS
jgi:hypothetical protein